MKTKLFFILLFACLSSFSQTLDETKTWIKEQITTLSMQQDVDVHYTVDFTDTDLVISTHFNQFVFTRTLPIKQISSITFEEKPATVWLVIWIKDNQNLVYFKDDNSYSNRVDIILLKDVNNNNMRERIKKAFTKLVSYYGGSIVPDTF